MHDDLLTQLAKIGSLKVISRTSVMEYKDTTKKIPQIAAELGVATIVEGGVQRSGSRIRFNAQLIDAQTDEHLWAETYDRELTADNLFDIQSEIARAIAKALQATLSPEEEASIDRSLTSNLDAWESYQRGVRMRQQQTMESILAGISEADRALELDPGFAAAWSLKAILLLQKFWFFDTDPKTRAAAMQAIQQGRAIDPTLPELDIAEGYYHYWGFRNYEKALPFMDRASKALPNDARVHQARSYVLRRMGEWEGCLAAMRRAAELDPRDSQNMADIGATLSNLRRYEEADLAFAKAQQIAPDEPALLWQVAGMDFNRTGDTELNMHINHLNTSVNPSAQVSTWRSALYMRDFELAQHDVDNWPESFLDTKDYRVTRALLTGLNHTYAGEHELAQPLLQAAEAEFTTLAQAQPDSYAINRPLCVIKGALGDLSGAQHFCTAALETAPIDAFVRGGIFFNTAIGLALAGNADAAINLLNAMMENETGPTLYPVIYHPAFDGIRDEPAYIELIAQYPPEGD